MPGFYIATQKHGCYIKFNGKQMHAILDPSSPVITTTDYPNILKIILMGLLLMLFMLIPLC